MAASESDSAMQVAKKDLQCPALEDVAAVLEKGLAKNFVESSVSVVECPDLTKEPFNLAASGLSGDARIADIGGVPYLAPGPPQHKDKIYSFDKVAQQMGFDSSRPTFVLGAGCGPAHVYGQNTELMPNLMTGDDSSRHNKTHYAAVDLQDSSRYSVGKLDSKEFCILMNCYACQGLPGKVIKVQAKKRTGDENFISCMRKSILENFGKENPVGMGGVFVIETGKANIHIMSDFTDEPLDTQEKINSWLKFYEMNAPLTCLSVFITADPGLDARLEHTHCFSSHGDGGHYHYDTTPHDVSYVGYFQLAEQLCRIDQPKETHSLGRYDNK